MNIGHRIGEHDYMRITTITAVFVALALISTVVLADKPTDAIAINAENWNHHPRILIIRKMYNEIRSGLNNKKLRYLEKDYSVLPRDCRGTYPIEKLAVAIDQQGRVRMYIQAQRISHDDLQTMEYYYDRNGRLRFVYMTNKSSIYATIENRVYISHNGKVFWDVTTEAGKKRFGEMTAEPAEIRSYDNKGTKDAVERAVVACAK